MNFGVIVILIIIGWPVNYIVSKIAKKLTNAPNEDVDPTAFFCLIPWGMVFLCTIALLTYPVEWIYYKVTGK